MATCCRCNCEFNLSSAKRSINRRYGKGTYEDYYSDDEVCTDCALAQISADYATGQELMELMGSGWDDD